MQAESFLLLTLSLLATSSRAHFVLQSPPPLGSYNDVTETTGPCDGYNITARNSVTNFPVAGYPIHVLTTHNSVVFEYRAALVNDTSAWVNLIPPVGQIGIGDYCLPSVPGYAPWVGLDTVLQVAQWAPDGVLYQCAAIVFATGSAAAVTSDCKNSTGVQASVEPSFTSSIPAPAGATLISTSTAPAGNSNVTIATTASTMASKTSASPTASKTASGAVIASRYQTEGGLWFVLAGLLGSLSLVCF